MNKVIKLTVIKSAVDNKVLKPDSDGYYKVTLGAFNVRNSAGAIYPFKGVKEIITAKDKIFNRRLTSGRLRGEANHPLREPGTTLEQFMLRNLDISMQTTCFHIKEVIIKETSQSENIPGIGNIVFIIGLIKPSGVFGPGLKESLDNPAEDTSFSIRCFTNDVVVGGNVFKNMSQIITWDWINEPGIKYASKLGNVNTESATLGTFTASELANIKSNLVNAACTVESEECTEVVDELMDDLNKKDILDAWIA